MRIGITGAQGYITGRFAAYVRETGHEAELISVRDDRWQTMDFSGFDAIVHGAALVHEAGKSASWADFERVNVRLSWELARKAKREGVKCFVLLSTIQLYTAAIPGRIIGGENRITADSPCYPKTLYARSKWEAEQMTAAMADEHFFVMRVRCPMVYGAQCPGNYNGLRTMALRLGIAPRYENKRSMLHVDNLSSFLLQCCLHPASGMWIPQDEEFHCTSQIIRQIAAIHGKKLWDSRLIGIIMPVAAFFLPPLAKAFSNLTIDPALSTLGIPYHIRSMEEGIREAEQPKPCCKDAGRSIG